MATVTAAELDITALQGQVRGQLIAPEDPGYDEARQIYNAMIDRRPLSRQVPATGGDQEGVRPRKPLPDQPEHPASGL